MSADVIHGPGATIPRHKPDLSDLCDICRPARERTKRIAAFHRSLVEFGYTTLTRDQVAESYDNAMWHKPTNGDVIALLIRSQLEEAGIVS